MAYTKLGLTTAVLEEMDAASTTRWDTAENGELQRKINRAFIREWKHILSINQYYRMQKVQPTSHATTARVAISGLTTGSTTTTKNFHRVLAILRDNNFYREVDFLDVPYADAMDAQGYFWYREGTDLAIFPKSTSTVYDVWVNWYPPTILQIANADPIDFPVEFEELLRYAGAAEALKKGGAESTEALKMSAAAEEIRQDLSFDIARTSTSPTFMKHPDFAIDWGG